MDTPTASPHTPHRHRYNNFLTWRRLHITDSSFILILALVVGILSGACAWLLKYTIEYISAITREYIGTSDTGWLIIITPVAGISFAAIFCRHIIHEPVDNGVARMVDKFKNRNYRLDNKTIYGSMVASALTLGLGGTAGSEGPIAYAGAGIGSRLGQIFRIKPHMIMILTGCGAAAGIAGIFKAPIGGALFAIEVLRIEVSTVATIGIFLATLAASLTAYILSGYTLDINVISPEAFDNTTLPWTMLLGIICGLYSLYYTHTGSITKRQLASIHTPWIKWLASGLAIGLMIYIFPALYGEGYASITNVINGHTTAITYRSMISLSGNTHMTIIIVCTGLLLLKGIGSSATNNGGGVAGDFAPTLFAGCALGLLYATALNSTGISTLDSSHYALIAMAGCMAGIIRAPLMSIFLTTEMIGGVDFLLPAAITSLVSYGLVMVFKHDTFYHSHPFASDI